MVTAGRPIVATKSARSEVPESKGKDASRFQGTRSGAVRQGETRACPGRRRGRSGQALSRPHLPTNDTVVLHAEG
jgi:hypothetical protein